MKATRYLRALAGRLEQAGLRDRALILFDLPLTTAFRHEVILLRPTRAEGDALSVREALHAFVPVVASDVVDRPAGTSTFATNDAADLRQVLAEVLDGGKETTKLPVGTPNDAGSGAEFVTSLLQIYRRQIDSALSDAAS
jgi:hypothetical protein